MFWKKGVLKSEGKKWDTLKNWPLIKSPQFFSYPHETWWKLIPHKVIIFTKFHEDRTKIEDFLSMASFWKCAAFFSSDFRSLFKFQNHTLGGCSWLVYFGFSILDDSSPCPWYGATPFDILQVPNVSPIVSSPDKILCYVEPSYICFLILHLSVSRGGNSALAQNCITDRESMSHG